MEKRNILKYSIINAFGTALYVIAIASFMNFLGKYFTDNTGNNTVLIPISMLMLFVFSAAFTGSLVFGRPVMWYLDGKKREALFLLIYTLGIFMALTVIAFMFLITLNLM
jgi:hypothetical protein